MPSFLKKIGLSNAVAFVSLIVAVLALWESHSANRASIQIRDLPVYSTGVFQGRDSRYLSIFRFFVSNNGGRAVTLNTISVPKQVAPVIGLATEAKSVKEIKSFTFFKVNLAENEYPIIPLLNRQPNDSILDHEEYVIRKKIEPGETAQINIGFEYRDQHPEVDSLLLAMEANFSDGTVVPIRGSINARIRRQGR